MSEWFDRAGGILLHPTSLPGPHGIGDLGSAAHRFVDFLADAGLSLWQVLPVGPTGYGDSPYASFSTFAGNPLLVSLERLVEDGSLQAAEIVPGISPPTGWTSAGSSPGSSACWTGPRGASSQRRPATGARHSSASAAPRRGWLDDYALFMAVKARHDERARVRRTLVRRRGTPGGIATSRRASAGRSHGGRGKKRNPSLR